MTCKQLAAFYIAVVAVTASFELLAWVAQYGWSFWAAVR